MANSEPEKSSASILDYLDRRVIIPRRGDAPRWHRQKATSVLLFGPPGTTKTTIVRAVAEGLGWPLVSLSPGNFINRGLENIEAQASEVFAQIHALSRAVVLFDECDELFRYREPSSGMEQMRGIAAFTTASMLPKLQDLFDRGEVVFFILTNFFRSIDPAIRRSGRIEHIIGVGPPDFEQRLQIISSQMDVDQPAPHAAAEKLAELTERFVRGELVIAAKKLHELWEHGRYTDPSQAEQAATEVANRFLPGLSVSEASYAEYRADAERYSLPHVNQTDVRTADDKLRRAREACHLCGQLQGNAARDLLHEKIGGDYVRRVLLETVWSGVMPSLGALTEGHVLLVPKSHVRRAADLASGSDNLTDDFDQSFDAEMTRVIQLLSNAYGGSIHAFEHGSSPGGRLVCTVDHAHIHFLPADVDPNAVLENPPVGTWKQIGTGIAGLRDVAGTGEYLYYRGSDDKAWVLVTSPGEQIPSQFLRARFAELLGNKLDYNWRENPQPGITSDTFKMLAEPALKLQGVLT